MRIQRNYNQLQNNLYPANKNSTKQNSTRNITRFLIQNKTSFAYRALLLISDPGLFNINNRSILSKKNDQPKTKQNNINDIQNLTDLQFFLAIIVIELTYLEIKLKWKISMDIEILQPIRHQWNSICNYLYSNLFLPYLMKCSMLDLNQSHLISRVIVNSLPKMKGLFCKLHN